MRFYRLQIAAFSAPDFSLIGFASLNGFSGDGTLLTGGTTGGAAGPIVVASNVTWLVNYAQRSNMTLRVLLTADIDCSPLSYNNSAPGYTCYFLWFMAGEQRVQAVADDPALSWVGRTVPMLKALGH